MNNFLAHSEKIRQRMLESISLSSVEELFSNIPKEALVKDFNLPEALSEMQAQKKVKSLANKNNTDMVSFLGAGVYNHFIPAAVGQIAGRWEFLTAYTLISRRFPKAHFRLCMNFNLYDLQPDRHDICNASVYDGASACAEAILMAARITKRDKVLVSDAINPQYKEVIETYMWANNIKINLVGGKWGFKWR